MSPLSLASGAEVSGTGTLPAVHAGAEPLEKQADEAVRAMLYAFEGLSLDPWIKEQILFLQGAIDQEGLTPDEMKTRIRRAVVLILGYVSNELGDSLRLLESIYPGFSNEFSRQLESHVGCLVTSARRLLEADLRIHTIRKDIEISILNLLARSRASFNHQKWDGAYNERGFRHYRANALHALERQRRKHKLGSVSCVQLMIDLDKFKDVNDRYGELAGDQVLQDILGLLRDGMRTSDVLGMPSGDEYLLFLPDTDEDGARYLVRRFLARFQTTTFKVRDRDGSEVALDGRDEKPKVGLSIGIASIVLNGDYEAFSSHDLQIMAERFGLLESRLDRESSLAMKGAKVLNNGECRVMTFDEASPRQVEINALLEAKNKARSKIKPG